MRNRPVWYRSIADIMSEDGREHLSNPADSIEEAFEEVLAQHFPSAGRASSDTQLPSRRPSSGTNWGHSSRAFRS
jgi:hypothetical protein